MSNNRLLKIVDMLSYGLLVFSILAVVLIADKGLINFYIIPKQYIFIGLMLISALMVGVKIILSKKIGYSRTILDIPLAVLLLVGLLSATFSSNIYYSFFGKGEFFVLNFIFFLFLIVLYFLLVIIVNTPKRWQGIVDMVILSGGVTSILFILKLIFNLDITSLLVGDGFNTINATNNPFGVWTIIIFVLSAGQLIKKEIPTSKTLSYFFIALISLSVLVLLGFKALWWILLAGLVLLLLVGASFVTHARLGWLSVLFATLVLTVVFIGFGSPQSLQQAIPPEVSLGIKSSWSITLDTTIYGVKNFLLGSGLGTFAIDFSQFRPASFNYDSVAWSLRFGQPFNTIFALISEGGLIFFVSFVFLVIFTLGHILHAWFKARSENLLKATADKMFTRKLNLKIEILLVAISWILLTVSMTMVFFGPVLWWLWWLLLSLTITGLSFINSNIVTDKEWKMEETPQYSLSFSFVLIIVMAVIIMGGVWGAKIYMGERAYAQALRSNNIEDVELKLREAISQRNKVDSYYVGLARVYLLRASEISRGVNPDMQQVSFLVAEAVNQARKATDISPRSVALWENLATMYDNAAVIIPEARQWSINSWVKASELEPTNPVLHWNLANNYTAVEDFEKAMESYKKAIELKTDYVLAYIGLAGIYEKNENLDEAVETYKKVLSSGTDNVDLLFNFGRLLYNRDLEDDRTQAENLWLKIIEIQPNHSNTLYSLGLLYEANNQKSKALSYYYKVRELNSDNIDILNKIKSIVGEPRVEEIDDTE